MKKSEKLEGMPIPNVINLIEAPERWKYMKHCFAEHGVYDVNYMYFQRWRDEIDIEILNVPDDISKGTFSSHVLAIKAWYEKSDDEIGVFFEDDVDFSPIEHWNFNFKEFLERVGNKWDALQLCGVYDSPWNMWTPDPIMVPRVREYYDHGLQVYVIKRKFAEKLVRFYFSHGHEGNVIEWKNPLPMSHHSTENNVLSGFGRCYHFPLFNHNVNDFGSMNIYEYTRQVDDCVKSYEMIDSWWKDTGKDLTLDEIFDYDREPNKKFMKIDL